MKRKFGIFSAIAITGAALLAIALSSVGVTGKLFAFRSEADPSYRLTLNTDNRITQSSASVQTLTRKTALNNDIQFLYSNCNASSQYHAVINANGSISNIDALSGISSFTPTFTTSDGELTFRASFDKVSWGEYAVLKSGVEYHFADQQHPNYIELSANGAAVSISSISYFYECSDSFVEPVYSKLTSSLSDYTGRYLIVDETSSVALKTINGNSNTFGVSITNSKISKSTNTEANVLTIEKQSGSSYSIMGYVDSDGEDEYLDYYTGSSTQLFWTSEYLPSITFSDGLFDINRNSYHLLFDGTKFTFNSQNTSSGRLVSLYKANFDPEDSNIPLYDVSLLCSDSRSSSYAVGDIFADFIGGLGLNVSLRKSDGTLSSLASNEFTYELKSGNATVSSIVPFESAGSYNVNISYKGLFFYSYYITVSAASNDYRLITNVNNLEVGQSVVITSLSGDSMVALSKEQRQYNRAATNVTATNGILNVTSNTCELVLGEGNSANTYSFYDASQTEPGYLYGATTNNNYMRTESTLTDASSFTISIDSKTAEATILSQGGTNYSRIRYNNYNGNNIFSCYLITDDRQNAVNIYAKGSGVPKVRVTGLELSTSSIELSEGSSYTLNATVSPEDATDKSLAWTSGDESIAIVDSIGRITALGAGVTTITATSVDNSNVSASCTVRVNPVSVTGISFVDSSISLDVGDSTVLQPIISPSNASDKSVSWSSSDASVASVSNGTITALKAGETTITVTTTDGSYTATCVVTVNNVNVTSFEIVESSVEMYVGDENVVLTTSITPVNATDKTVTWTSSDESVATVSGGSIHAVSDGTVTITGTCNGFTDTCEVTVKPASEKPQTEEQEATFGTGTNLSQCTVNGHDGVKVGTSSKGGAFKVIVPANSTKLTIYIAAWNGVTGLSLNISGATTNPSSVSLTADSGVSGNSPFTLSGNEEDYKFEITLTNITNETSIVFTTSTTKRCVAWKATASVATSGSTTPVSVSSVSVSPSSKSLNIGETAQLSATVLPADATNKSVIWSSSNSSIASVDSSGLVTAIVAGTATIYATSDEDSSIKGSCSVTVTNPTVAVTGVSLSVSSKTLTVDESFTLSATVSPSNASNKSVTWSITSGSNKVSLSSTSGSEITVTADAVGSATVRVTTNSGSKTADCNITVQASGGTTPIEPTLVTSNTTLSNGDKVIIKTIESPLVGVAGYNGNKDATVSSTESSYKEFTVESANSSGWKLKDDDAGKYIANPGSNEFKYSDTGGTCYVDSSGHLMCNSRYLCVNGSNYRFYGSIGSFIPFYVYEVNSTPTNPTSISIPETATVGINKTLSLDVTYSAGANQNKEIDWYTSNASVASINATTGEITGVSAGSCTITAKLHLSPSTIFDTCTLTVTEQQVDKWTIMIYMCGADLESESGQASGDIKEILAVNNQPDDVNIIIETGGANSWKLGSSYIGGSDTSIPSNKLARWHVEGNKIYKDAELTSACMGKSGTYQSFLEWGLSEYPAQKTGVVLWNHGGGLDGVCFDEKFNDDALTNSEMKTAHQNAIGSNNKLEFIGFDACLMQNMEIAEFNSSFYKYQVASQESENGSGWYYTGWIDNVYNNNSTTVILKEIVDTFITTQGTSSDQTLSYLDLSYAATFKTAFESYASALKSKFQSENVKGSTFASWAKSNIKNYSESGYCGYGQFDIKDFMSKCQAQSSYQVDSSYVTTVNNALTNFVGYSRKGSKAGQSNGVCCTYRCASAVSYTSSDTNFTNWLAFNNSYHA